MIVLVMKLGMVQLDSLGWFPFSSIISVFLRPSDGLKSLNQQLGEAATE